MPFKARGIYPEVRRVAYIPELLPKESIEQDTEDACGFMPEMAEDEVVEQGIELELLLGGEAHGPGVRGVPSVPGANGKSPVLGQDLGGEQAAPVLLQHPIPLREDLGVGGGSMELRDGEGPLPSRALLRSARRRRSSFHGSLARSQRIRETRRGGEEEGAALFTNSRFDRVNAGSFRNPKSQPKSQQESQSRVNQKSSQSRSHSKSRSKSRSKSHSRSQSRIRAKSRSKVNL